MSDDEFALHGMVRFQIQRRKELRRWAQGDESADRPAWSSVPPNGERGAIGDAIRLEYTGMPGSMWTESHLNLTVSLADR